MCICDATTNNKQTNKQKTNKKKKKKKKKEKREKSSHPTLGERRKNTGEQEQQHPRDSAGSPVARSQFWGRGGGGGEWGGGGGRGGGRIESGGWERTHD